MPLASFATPQQMEDRSQGDIPAATPFLQEALDAASTRIRNRCGWHVYPEVSEVGYRVQSRPGWSVWLPTTYLATVDSVNDGTVDLGSLLWFRDGRVDGIPAGIATVNFTHGYVEAPADLVALTLELAVGDLVARGVIREQTLASSITWARASGRLAREDMDELAEYKIGYQP